MPDSDRRDEIEKQTRIPWWLWPHILSLEAPVIAVIWQMMLARTHRVALMPGTAEGLALAVWLVYLTDRLFDGLSSGGNAADIRHAFYHRHWRLFAFGVIPLAGAAMIWIGLYRIPEGLLWQCSALALLIGIYLACFPARHHRRLVGTLGGIAGLLVIVGIFMLPMGIAPKLQFAMIGLVMMTFGFYHRLDSAASSRIPKEPLGALLFALGCSVGVQFYSMSDGFSARSIDVALLWSLFSMNMFGISRFEQEAGSSDANSFAVVWPRLSKLYPVILCSLIVASGAIVFVPSAFPARTGQLAGGVGVSLLLLALLWLVRSRLSPLSYRVLADLALAVPAVWLLF